MAGVPTSTIDAQKLIELCNLMREWAHGHSWPTMFARMTTGLMYAQTGLSVAMAKLGMLSPGVSSGSDTPKKRQKLGAVQLGVQQNLHSVHDREDLLELMDC